MFSCFNSFIREISRMAVLRGAYLRIETDFLESYEFPGLAVPTFEDLEGSAWLANTRR